MTNCRSTFSIVGVVVLLSLATGTKGIKQPGDESDSTVGDNRKWTDQNYLFTAGSIIGAVCVLTVLMAYTVIRYRRSSLFGRTENTDDKEKGPIESTLDELFKRTANDDEDKTKDGSKRKSFPNEEDQRTAKVHGFLMRAMTIPQSVIQTVGRLQTVQVTEPSAEQVAIKKAEQHTAQSIGSPIGSTASGTVERPANFKKPQSKAVKSPSSNYLKKSPSPTGSKSPPQQTPSQPPSDADKQEAAKNEETASRDSECASSSADNTSRLDAGDESCGEFKLGKLQFCLKYNYEKHALSVSMIKCMSLPGKNTINTYVKLQLLPDKKHKVKTRTIRKNQNPCYAEDFTFFNIQPTQLEGLALHFIVMSFDRYSRDEVLGEVLYPCSHDQFDTLEKQVCLTLDVQPKGLLSKAQGRGELLLSLSYHPASYLLSLVVLKAKNLSKQNITGLPDPYVKINLFINNKRIAKKKTHSKKRTLNPIYNEIFSFDLSEYLPAESSESTEDFVDLAAWQNIKLELLVIDYDRITRNENIGCLTLSINDEDATVRKHMKDMLTSPRKQIACWHKLSNI